MKRRYSIFHVQGGLGKHIAATAVAKCIKNNYPDRDLIVVCPFIDIFINLKYVDRVYPLGQTQYFYQNYIENKDSINIPKRILFHPPTKNEQQYIEELKKNGCYGMHICTGIWLNDKL